MNVLHRGFLLFTLDEFSVGMNQHGSVQGGGKDQVAGRPLRLVEDDKARVRKIQIRNTAMLYMCLLLRMFLSIIV